MGREKGKKEKIERERVIEKKRERASGEMNEKEYDRE